MFDWSTINREELAKLPYARLGHGLRIGKDYGSGCFMDPPGYPTYFLQGVYTPRGNLSASAETLLLNHHTIEVGYHCQREFAKQYGTREEIMRRLWLPLPLTNRRSWLWIQHCYQHWANCYTDDNSTSFGKILIYPVPWYKLSKNHPDFNREITEYAMKVAIPENHTAYRHIKSFYPDYTPDIALINNPPKRLQEDWWERYAEIPSEEDCPGHLGVPHGTTDYCRLCGRHRAN